MQLPWLDQDTPFPDTSEALDDPNGLIAAGGDLSPERLLSAYKKGIFPWFSDDQPILWWTPSPRAVLKPENIHISKSLKKRIKRDDFKITADQAFDEVMFNCAHIERHNQDGTWITDDMLFAYQQLYLKGHAHSLEVWQDEKLVGGLYGIAIGKVFFGESMFSHATDASKLAFVALAQRCQAWGFAIIDCQVTNPHLLSMGVTEIEREQFEHYLKHGVEQEFNSDWQAAWSITL